MGRPNPAFPRLRARGSPAAAGRSGRGWSSGGTAASGASYLKGPLGRRCVAGTGRVFASRVRAMAESRHSTFAELLTKHRQEVLSVWSQQQQQDLSIRNNLLKPGEMDQQTREFLDALVKALSA